MAYALGIDVGTSFTAAAIARHGDDGIPAPRPLGLGVRGGPVPSVIFLGDDGHVLVGESAERRGVNDPDRVVREFKRRIGDTVPIVLDTLSVTPEDIFATMARWVVDRAEEREGAPPDAIVITHPASWRDHKTALVRAALAGVGLADVDLMSEPEAAALHYASQERVPPGSTIAVYDLGGGTFDVAILRKRDTQAVDVVGRPEGIERLGGADFDDAVFDHVASHQLDAFATLDPTDVGVLLALSRIRRECTEAKEALSFDSETSIPVLLPGTQAQVRIVRSEFESMIDPAVRQTIATMKHAVKAAAIEPADLAGVLLIGGSSRVPLVAQLLSEEFGRPLAIDADPKAAISLGAAFAALAALQRDERDVALADGDTTEFAAAAAGSGRSRFRGDAAQPVAVAPQNSPMRARASQAARVLALAAAVGALIAVAGSTPTSPDLTSAGASAADETPRLETATDAGPPTATAPNDTTAPSPSPIPAPIHPNERGPLKPPTKSTDEQEAEPPADTKGTDSDADAASPDNPSTDIAPDSGPAPAPVPTPTPTPTPTPVPTPTPTPVPTPDPSPSPTPDPTPDQPAPDPVTDPDPAPQPAPEPDHTHDPAPSPDPEPDPAPEP